MPTITLPDHSPRHGGKTLELRTDRAACIVRWEGWMWCSLPVIHPDGNAARAFVPVRLGVETAIANGMAVEVAPERDDPTDRPVLIRSAAPAPTDRENEWKSP